ncbi:MAG: flippase-like domain-containing protein [Gemmatimonadaceae bacterium]|nr:flippase-like domain-containing protein [Gemmatimonadaceae bacterium]
MTPKRWLLTILSFAAALGASAWVVWSSWPAGHGRLSLPLLAHLVAFCGAAAEVTLRAFKLTWSARALDIPLTLGTAFRTCLGGDFGASVTPSRSGAEPARFLIMAEAKTPLAGIVMVLWAEIVLEVLSLLTIALLIALLFPGTDRAVSSVVLVIASYAITVLAISMLGVALSRRNANGPPPKWAPKIGLNAGRWRAIQKALRQLRGSVDAVRNARRGWMFGSFVASALHVAARLCILPGLVLFVAPATPVAPLVAWPLAMQYGAAVVPAPGGGGAVELVFKQTLGNVIPAEIFGASLVWWRFYTIYLYIVVGALVAGSTVMRSLRPKATGASADPDAPSPPPISITD